MPSLSSAPRPLRAPLAALLVVAAPACQAERAYQDWVGRRPEPARLASLEPVEPLALVRPVELGDVTPAPSLTAVAGDLSGGPDRRPVPFRPETPPLAVLRADLERLLAAPGDPNAAPLRLDVVLVRAFVHRTYHVVRKSTMVGTVILDLSFVDPWSGQVVSTARILGEHTAHPTYVTSDVVEAALNRAYSQALAQLGAAVREVSSPPAP